MINDIGLTITKYQWLVFFAAIFLGGTVKGALGVGLPLIAIPLLSFAFTGLQAIAFMAIPVLMSNLIQMHEAGRNGVNFRRFNYLILFQIIGTIVTLNLTLSLSHTMLNKLLSISVLIAVIFMLYQPALIIPPEREHWVSIAVGCVSGFLGGISSLTGPVIITYLMALRLDKSTFVGTISLIYISSALPLYIGMASYGQFDLTELLLSLIALVPMMTGLTLGKHMRSKIQESIFRSILLVFLTVVAIALYFK